MTLSNKQKGSSSAHDKEMRYQELATSKSRRNHTIGVCMRFDCLHRGIENHVCDECFNFNLYEPFGDAE